MESKQLHEVALRLIRAGLEEVVASPLPDLSLPEWQAVLDLSSTQNVAPIIYDGLQRYHKEGGETCPQAMKFTLFGAAQMAERVYASHEKAIRSLTGVFAEHGIRTMILKGYALSLCYPKPNHRPCGDIDIYQFGDYRRADALMESRFGTKIDRTHHHHTVYRWDGVMVENHYDFVNVHAHTSSAWLERQFKQLAQEPSEMVGDVVLPSPNLHALFLLRHAGAHFAGERITWRHLLDWIMFCKRYAADVDWGYVERCAKEAGCYTFLSCMRRCCDRLIGIKYENTPLAERMWNDILHPEFQMAEQREGNQFAYKARRWWGNRWKHKMVYRENLLSQLFTLTLSHIRKPD